MDVLVNSLLNAPKEINTNAMIFNRYRPFDHGSLSARHNGYLLNLIVMCWFAGLMFTTAHAEDRISLTGPIERLTTANNDVQYDAAQRLYAQTLAGTPCETAINDFINFNFSIMSNSDLYLRGTLTYTQFQDSIESLESKYDSLENLAYHIVWVCGGRKESIFVLVNRLTDLGVLTDEPQNSASTIFSLNNLTKE